jgi:hypothetical protein
LARANWLASSTLANTLIAFITPTVSFFVAMSSRVKNACSGVTTRLSSNSGG